MMDDLISRQVMRDTMYHEAFEVDSDLQKWDSGCWIRYKMFENVIDKIPSARQWIPCSERLPEKKGDYLVTDDSGGAAWVEKAWFMRSDDGRVLWEYVNVTAWMPLPAPYREETES